MFRSLLTAFVLIAGLSQLTTAAELIDFDTYPDGSPVPEGYTVHDQWRSLGVVFTMGDSSRAAYAVPHSCSLSQPNHVGGDPTVVAWFVDPLTGAPAVTDFVGTAQDLCWGQGEGILMQAYDIDGELVAEEFNAGPGHLVTFSFPEPIVAMLRMEEYLQGIDDFTFNIPVSASSGVRGMEGAAGSAVSLRIAPNPGSGSTGVRIHLGDMKAGQSSLCIFEPGGRLVRSWSCEFPSDRSVEWNGRDDKGDIVASGVYLVRLAGAGGARVGRAVFIR